jgi:hypothetical protein
VKHFGASLPITGGVGSAHSGSANPPVRATSTDIFMCNRYATMSRFG